MRRKKDPSNWLDRAISWVAPRAGRARMTARLHMQLARRAYDGASTSDRLGDWNAAGTSADAEIEVAGPRLRARTREAVRNNPWACQAVDVIATETVGAAGITTRLRSAPGASGLDRRTEGLSQLWTEWAGTTKCDADGCDDLGGLQVLIKRCDVESGEVLIRRRYRRAADALPVPLQLQVLEPDFLDTSRDSAVSAQSGSRTEQGIVYDALGRRTGYWLFREHPGGSHQINTESTLVPAEDIIHLYDKKRPGQQRGVPRAHSVMTRLHDLDGYEDAQLVRQRAASLLMGFIHGDESSEVDAKAAKAALGGNMEPGTWVRTPGATGASFTNPPQVSGFSEYVSQVLHGVAAGFGISYEALTGDYSRVNFSSGRMGFLRMHRNVRRWQQMMISRVLLTIWEWFKEAARLQGYSTDGVVAAWTPPRREMIDPTKEIPALRDAVRAGFITLPEAIRQMGGDPEEVFEETARTNETIDELDLVFDSDARKTSGKAGGANGEAGEPEEPEVDTEGDENDAEAA